MRVDVVGCRLKVGGAINCMCHAVLFARHFGQVYAFITRPGVNLCQDKIRKKPEILHNPSKWRI